MEARVSATISQEVKWRTKCTLGLGRVAGECQRSTKIIKIFILPTFIRNVHLHIHIRVTEHAFLRQPRVPYARQNGPLEPLRMSMRITHVGFASLHFGLAEREREKNHINIQFPGLLSINTLIVKPHFSQYFRVIVMIQPEIRQCHLETKLQSAREQVHTRII